MEANRYEFLQLIGEGGVGKVYRAFDRSLNRNVAIKRIKQGTCEDSAKDAALTEAKALCSAQHPHIVSIFDVGRDEDGYFIVMELIEGENLECLAKHGKMLAEQFIPFCLQAQEALIGAHQLGILHRDLKPANVMLQWLPSGSLHVKLVDFGLAEIAQEAATRRTTSVNTNLLGSLHFMSPEYFENTEMDARSDLYAMGCLYYFALTQRHPFDGSSSVDVMLAHLKHQVVPIAKVRPDLPAWLSAWIMRHMERDPAMRPQSALEAFDCFRSQVWAPSDNASSLISSAQLTLAH